MTRCLQCNGILAKNERVCYSCGECAPVHSGSAGNGYSLLLALAFIVSLGLTAFSFLSGR
ncbi:MAG TPA: hypothetical protein VNV82_13635 [Bryobacteraceae bacterium]|nr:hypothetical protein [Bryobacteraceae bacterium]